MCVCTYNCVCVCNQGIHCKVSAHIIAQAEKSQDVHLQAGDSGKLVG